MFHDFFHLLKDKFKVPVTLPEWMDLQAALQQGLHMSGLTNFYHVSRACLVKRETDFDKFDLAFSEYFKGVQTPEEILERVLAGMDKVDPLELTPEQKAQFDPLELEEVRRRFEEQLKEGHYNHHVGGDKAIGTGGRSTQGALGYHETGVRIGQGYSRHRRAIQIAERREFRNYNPNLLLDTMSIKAALARMRRWVPLGPMDQVDIDGTIDLTARNAGEIEIAYEREKRAGGDVLLMMDAGGSMTPHARLVSRLFSAANTLFHDLKYFYFHNTLYQDLWTDIELMESRPTADLWHTYGPNTKVIFVGDAAMAPSELYNVNGCIDYYYDNPVPSVDWLRGVRSHFKKIVWLNPDPPDRWVYSPTVKSIAGFFRMETLTLDGLNDAIRYLME